MRNRFLRHIRTMESDFVKMAPSDQAPSACKVRIADKTEVETVSKKISLKKSVFRGGAHV